MAYPYILPAEQGRTARTLLLTVLGEAVFPQGRTVWKEVLVAALGALGVSPAAARQVLARAANDGWLSSERVGRRSLLTVNDDTWANLRVGRARTMSFGAAKDWDETWLLVAVTVPEEHREVRYQLRTELGWLGFGSMGNGNWISPHAGNEQATLRLLQADKGLQDMDAYVFITRTPVNRSPRELARAAWDLDGLRARYTDFEEKFSSAHPGSLPSIFACWIDLLTTWRHFPLFDPELPDSILPEDWPRERAHRLFHKLHDEWLEPALAYFQSLETSR